MCNTFPCTRFLQYFELQHCTVKLAQNAKSIVCFIFVWIVTLKQMKTFFNNRVHSIILLFVEKSGPYSIKKYPTNSHSYYILYLHLDSPCEPFLQCNLKSKFGNIFVQTNNGAITTSGISLAASNKCL